MGWVRAAGLMGVRSEVESRGGDAGALARSAGLPDGALDDHELLVQDTAIAAILELAARELDCPDFGLRVALRQDLTMLGPLAVALQNSPTAADALECTSRYLFVHARSIDVRLVADPLPMRGVVALQYGGPPGTAPFPRQSIDMGLLFLHRSLVSLVGDGYGLRSVHHPHSPPRDARRHEELFGVPVTFNESEALLRIPADLTSRPLRGVDQVTRQLALHYLEAQVVPAGRPVSSRVRAGLDRSLGTAATTLAAMASLLSMSPRTLQRHLTTERSSFSDLLDDARRQRADQLLRETDLPVSQIASAVGLQDASTLSRYARRWWGTSARARRHDRGDN